MNTLKDMLKNLPPDSPIGLMVTKSSATRKPRKRILVNAKPPPAPDLTILERKSQHELEVIATRELGFGICTPCSDVKFRPASRVLAHGYPAQVKWALHSVEYNLLVVLFDEPHELVRKPHMTSRWEIVGSDMCKKV